VIGVELASQAEYKRLRSLASKSQVQFAAFVVMRDERRETQPGWRELLNHVKSEGTRGERPATKVWRDERGAVVGNHNECRDADTLRVSLEDIVQSDLIFTTLMGDDVESRRKFIEDNALDVKNLDV